MKTNYKIQGTPNSPVLMFSNSLGADLTMWDDLVPHLLPYFRVLQYDTRGHGQSELTDGPYTIEMLGKDVIDLLDQLKIDKVYFCGLSMGGMIGQYLGIHHPNRLHKLIISNTDAKIGTAEGWKDRIKTINEQGMQAIVDGTMEKWFTKAFHSTHPYRIAEMREIFLANRIVGYTACCAALGAADFREDIKKISVETLIITGDEDEVTNVEQAKALQKEIAGAQLKVFNARHLPSTELPAYYAETLIDFIVGEDGFDRGMHVRRTVLGSAHVDRANGNKNEFNTDFQEFISQYAWGEIWTRPGLSKHTRSLITLSMLVPLNKKAEFKMHVRAAFNNGVTIAEIKEVILQSGIYCGLPAANDAMHSAEEVFEELGLEYKE
ncbi:bifunctional 3-oxoadipate enol-lactonase/4-carboxymuconolactone decarboxylase PcaDC [Maribacter cobaltidurans]|uniref:AraC family transcriptional regulator n=2 Tax=Maribacter cobaltidurans TaxID=1178778 RepID=A0A223V8P4_9FLAO|nr:3-oxoadipate enol-lactonase [Maribacter cobaltidurans]ASV31676.1 AraC family transcriptional regulator [Maribacter cobaltidurans]GGD93902.1 3-oxoadipate enol-lactonase [Maribacter cobaltidurans]